MLLLHVQLQQQACQNNESIGTGTWELRVHIHGFVRRHLWLTVHFSNRRRSLLDPAPPPFFAAAGFASTALCFAAASSCAAPFSAAVPATCGALLALLLALFAASLSCRQGSGGWCLSQMAGAHAKTKGAQQPAAERSVGCAHGPLAGLLALGGVQARLLRTLGG